MLFSANVKQSKHLKWGEHNGFNLVCNGFLAIADTFIVYALFIASNKCDDLLNKGLMGK